MELRQYNVAQCLYINAFADFLINYYSNNCPDVNNELFKYYLKIFDRNVRVLHMRNTLFDYNQTTQFGNSRFFFNSGMSFHEMTENIFEIKLNEFKFISNDYKPFYNKPVFQCDPHQHTVSTNNLNNYLILGAGLLTSGVLIYYLSK